MKFKIVFLSLLLLCLAMPGLAQERIEPLSIETSIVRLTQTGKAATGLDVDALLVLTLSPIEGWYAYAPAPEDPLVRPPRLELVVDDQPLPNFLPPGMDKPDPFEPDKFINAYAKPTPLFVPLPDSALGQSVTGLFTAVLCDGDKCRLIRETMEFDLPASLEGLPSLIETGLMPVLLASLPQGPVEIVPPTPRPEATIITTDTWNLTPRPFAPALEASGLFSAILLGFLAGLILNVMPCVLPVVSLKLSALLSGAAEEDERVREQRFREHNFFFGLGAVLWFLFLAVLLGFGGLAWGELFQSAWIVGGLAALLLLLSLSLFGLFHLPVIDLRFDQSMSHPKLKALSTGMLTTLLATPCSGPLLGGVLGWTLLRPGAEIAVVFASIGLGMALPYFMMIPFPGLVRFFPRPGPWLGHVEHGVALFLLGAVIYLTSILPDIGLTPWLAAAWCLGAAFWVFNLSKTSTLRFLFRGLALTLAVLGPLWIFLPETSTDPWVEFNASELRAELGTKQLAVDFTADWCPTCKVLEATVLTNENVSVWAEQYDTTFIRADLTEDNPEAEALLRSLGSQSIPLVAVFPQGNNASSPIVIRDLFTAGQLEEALGRARQ